MEACFRLFKFKLHKKSHSIERLPVHLEYERLITFVEHDRNLRNNIQRAIQRQTKLTAWFRLNQQMEAARQYLYAEIPIHFVWNSANHEWIPRQQRGQFKLTRLHSVSPRQRELFFLRILLLNVRGATSFQNLRTVNGHVCQTYEQAAILRNLVQNDEQWLRCLEEAANHLFPNQLRQLFASILTENNPPNCLQLWLNFRNQMSEDFLHNQHIGIMTNDRAYNLSLIVIEHLLRAKGCNCQKYNLPTPQPDTFDPIQRVERAYTTEEYQEFYQNNLNRLNQEQRQVFDRIIQAISYRNPVNNCYFLDGPGGTGKTFLIQVSLKFIKIKLFP